MEASHFREFGWHFRGPLLGKGTEVPARVRYIAIAEQARDAEDDSVADLIVDVTLAEVDRDLAELREIDVALERLAEGTYGQCETCAEEIDRARLEVQPAAVRCLACQAAFEKSHQQSTPRS